MEYLEAKAAEKIHGLRNKVKGAADAQVAIVDHNYDVQIYTDGSASPTTGLCGAGYLVAGLPGTYGFLAQALPCGKGYNNVGELHAVGVAARAVRIRLPPERTKILLASDSKYALGIIQNTITTKTHLKLAALVYKEIETLSEQHDLTVIWVPGHMGIWGNEVADTQAKQGLEMNCSPHISESILCSFYS